MKKSKISEKEENGIWLLTLKFGTFCPKFLLLIPIFFSYNFDFISKIFVPPIAFFSSQILPYYFNSESQSFQEIISISSFFSIFWFLSLIFDFSSFIFALYPTTLNFSQISTIDLNNLTFEHRKSTSSPIVVVFSCFFSSLTSYPKKMIFYSRILTFFLRNSTIYINNWLFIPEFWLFILNYWHFIPNFNTFSHWFNYLSQNFDLSLSNFEPLFCSGWWFHFQSVCKQTPAEFKNIEKNCLSSNHRRKKLLQFRESCSEFHHQGAATSQS